MEPAAPDTTKASVCTPMELTAVFDPSTCMDERTAWMRKRAAEFMRLATEARDPVIHAELVRLATLYEAQAAKLARGETLPTDPGEAS